MRKLFLLHFWKNISGVFLFTFLCNSLFINGQLGQYTFTNGTDGTLSPNVTTQPTNGTFSSYTTVNTTNNATANVFNRQGWNTATTDDLTEYNSFTIKPTDGYVMNLTSITFDHRLSALGNGGNTTSWSLRSSLDNYASVIATNNITVTTLVSESVTLPSSFSALKTAVTFRLYIKSARNGTTTWRNDNVTLNGTISALPAIVTVNPSSSSICRGTVQPITASGGLSRTRSINNSGAINLSIPDNNATGINNSLNVSNIPNTASNPEIRVQFDITHSYNADLEVNLVAPNGQIINLVADIGGSGNNFTNPLFSSSNAGNELPTANTSNISGSYRALGATTGFIATTNLPTTSSLSNLLGTLNGNWTIRVYDDALNDLGTLNSWNLTIFYDSPPTWSPITDLYTDAAATIPYTASTALATVYAKPTTTRTYTATATNGILSTTETASSTITVQQLPTASAGGSTNVFVGESTTVTGASASNGTIVWTHNGTGFFDEIYFPVGNQFTTSPTYYTESDDFGQTVTLTMTVTGLGACSAQTATATHTFVVDGRPALWTYQCGTTLNTVNDYVYAYAYPGATMYRFRVNDGFTSQVFETPASVFYFALLPTFSYNTTYTCDVSCLVGGSWTAYGPTCSISTPFLPFTQVQSSQCGTTLPLLNTPIYADLVEDATGYRFRVSDGGTTQIFDNPSRMFNLTQFVGYQYNTTYTIDVAVNYGGWQTYGASCTVTTPSAPSAGITGGSCGTTLANMDVDIYCDEVPGATTYRFQLVNGGTTLTIDKPSRTFKFSQVSGIQYGTTYAVSAATFVNGSWGSFGSACNITSPSAGSTQLITSQCGMTLTNIQTDLYCDEIAGATTYRFRVTNANGTATIDKPSRTFKLSQLSNVIYSGVNTIDVDVLVNGSWTGYGSSCTVTSPSTPSTYVLASYCGTTIPTSSTLIFCEEVPGATQYRFRLTNGTSVTATNTVRFIRLSNFTGLSTNTPYTVDVEVEIGGSWQGYGSSCSITTPGTLISANSDEEIFAEMKIEAVNPTTNSIEDASELTKFNVFPNPFENQLYFNSGEFKIGEKLLCSIYNTEGKLVFTKEITCSPLNLFEVNLNKGFYIIEINSSEVKRSMKIIKN